MLSPELMHPANPFGPVSEERLLRLEAAIGMTLPEEYRAYLARFNGAEPLKTHFSLPSKARSGFNVHHVYGVHDGPSYLRLQDNWRPQDFYDLRLYRSILKGFIVFAQCGTGELLLLKLQFGAVHLLDPESIVEAGMSKHPDTLPILASSFDAFILSLKTLAETLKGGYSAEEVAEIQDRLAALRRRAQDE